MSFWQKIFSPLKASDLSEKEWALKMHSPGSSNYDYYALPFNEFLLKHYANPNLNAWRRWQRQFIEPAFDLDSRGVLANPFDYRRNQVHDFNAQAEIYESLKSNSLLDTETQKFVAFLGGLGFFKTYEISTDEWFDVPDWYNPGKKEPQQYPLEEQCTIRELLAMKNGLGYFKTILTGIPFLRRGREIGDSLI